MTKIWGRPLWIFMHTYVEKIDASFFQSHKTEIIQQLYNLCLNLPCQDCINHAKQYFKRYNMLNINNKENIIQYLFHFHNAVNKNTKKRLFTINEMEIYKKYSFDKVTNLLFMYMNYRGNRMDFINSQYRRNSCNQIIHFIRTNRHHFVN